MKVPDSSVIRCTASITGMVLMGCTSQIAATQMGSHLATLSEIRPFGRKPSNKLTSQATSNPFMR